MAFLYCWSTWFEASVEEAITSFKERDASHAKLIVKDLLTYAGDQTQAPSRLNVESRNLWCSFIKIF